MSSGSSQRVERGRKSDKRITRYAPEELSRLGGGETDWARVDALSDTEIEAAIRDDPDWSDATDSDWSKAVMVSPTRKRAVSIRLDEDVIEFFKRQGDGYQTRMNAVLRRFMNTAKEPKSAE